MAMGSAHYWPITGHGCSGQGAHPFTGEGLAEADAVAGGLADLRVVQGRSTVAVARVLGISSSNAAGFRFKDSATERFS